MCVTFYMNCVSAHQLPLAREVQRLVGAENFTYIDGEAAAQKLQMVDAVEDVRVIRAREGGRTLALAAEVVLTGLRDIDLLESRAKAGLQTFYYSERWFKPIRVGSSRFGFGLPGVVRMLVPRYRRMVKRFVAWANGDSGARVLAVGPWARKDFLRMGVKAERIVDWGYFVAPSTFSSPSPTLSTSRSTLRVLWVGRMLRLKRVDTLIRAVACVWRKGLDVRLTLVGDGPERASLERLARSFGTSFAGRVEFHPPVDMSTVRSVMRSHDVFVFPSDGYEGWGAVVSEALEEGLAVLGSRACGACPALLPTERLFPVGDWRKLAVLLEKEQQGVLPSCDIGDWTARHAAKRLLMLAGEEV